MLDTKDWLWIKDLNSYGLNLSQISKKTGFDRKTVHKYVYSTSESEPKKRTRKESKLDINKKHLNKKVQQENLPAACRFREIKDMGFTGKYTIVRDNINQARLLQMNTENQKRR